MRAVVRIALPLILLLMATGPARAQSMEDILNRLFVFQGSGDALFLVGSAGIPSTEVHGDHFIPSEVETNGSLLGVFTNAIATNIANFPLSSTVASQTFSFVGGVPTPTSTSFGPIFAERAQTLGRGRFDVGFNYSSINFSQIRGTPLSDVQFNFIHDNVDFPNCDTIFETDCSDLGAPAWEHDVIALTLDLDIEAEIYAFYASVGVLDWLDVSVAVPVVSLGISGSSVARVEPASTTPLNHFFGGTPENPVLSAQSSASGSTTGLGDVAGRVKARVLDGQELDVALLAEVRLPTGREEDFLGTGETSARGLLIASATLGDFSPHVNAGYAIREGDADDGVLLVAGFDHRLSDWATFAADILGDFAIGDVEEDFPQDATFEVPFQRTVDRTNIPNMRDNRLDGSVGFKLRTGSGVVLVANALIALNDGAMRDRVIPTFGLQYSR